MPTYPEELPALNRAGSRALSRLNGKRGGGEGVHRDAI